MASQILLFNHLSYGILEKMEWNSDIRAGLNSFLFEEGICWIFGIAADKFFRFFISRLHVKYLQTILISDQKSVRSKTVQNF